MFAEDMSVFFDVPAGFARACTLNGVPLKAILDHGPAEAYDPPALTPVHSALFHSAEAPGAAEGQVFLDDGGVSYRVRQVLPELPDGALTRLMLARG